jgi:hypothetical protein
MTEKAKNKEFAIKYSDHFAMEEGEIKLRIDIELQRFAMISYQPPTRYPAGNHGCPITLDQPHENFRAAVLELHKVYKKLKSENDERFGFQNGLISNRNGPRLEDLSEKDSRQG